MRLFQIRDKSAGTLPACYPDKPAAKLARDELEGPRQDTDPRRYAITPGPDHRNYGGDNRG